MTTSVDLNAKIVGFDRAREMSKAWLGECICGENGKPLPILANVLIALRAVMPHAFSYDEMQRAPDAR